jgi:hypothetical protein
MNRIVMLSSALAVTLLCGGAAVAEEIKSGPQVGSSKIPAFSPLHVNGPDTDKKVCLVCKNGGNPVAMVFAREVNENVASLAKKLDEATAKNSECNMGSFFVFLGEEETLKPKLKELADKQKLDKTVLSITEKADGPPGYQIAKDADVTVVLYVKRNVKANYTFKKGALNSKSIDAIMADVKKILPEEK